MFLSNNLGTRYMAFGGANYYPGGGWKDYIGTFDNLEILKGNLQDALANDLAEWVQVVDTTTNQIVYENWQGKPSDTEDS